MQNVPALVSTCAGAVSTVGDALGPPGLADVEGQGLRVHGDVGGDAVVTDTAVGKVVGVAVVGFSGHGGDAGLLQADERTLGPLV